MTDDELKLTFKHVSQSVAPTIERLFRMRNEKKKSGEAVAAQSGDRDRPQVRQTLAGLQDGQRK